LVAAPAGFSATIMFSGALAADDSVQTFLYSVQNTSLVTIDTTSFATGGFAPILSVFDNTGALQFYNVGPATNDCVNNAKDPATGACWDARLTWNSVAGVQYIVTLTEDDNLPLGPTLADGFFEQGNGNFTAKPPFNPPVPGGMFLLSGPIQRTGNWAVTFQSADPTLTASIPTAVPEPSSAAVFLTLAASFAIRRRTRVVR
jgi:hypothetical protein